MKTTMKKLLAFVLATVMAFSMVACGGGGNDEEKPSNKPAPTPTVEEKIDTTYLKQLFVDYECDFGISYLGYCPDEFDTLNDYFDSINLNTEEYNILSFIYDIPEENFIDINGNELYCVVAKDENATITVSEWIIDEYNDWQGEEGNVLYHEKNDGTPILIRCNVSEIMPDILVTIEESDGDVFYIIPSISQMDGNVYNYFGSDTWFYDFTPYAELYPDWSEPWGDDWSGGDNWDDGAVLFDIEYLMGSWSTTVYTDDDRYLDGSLSFYDDGTMEFCYGVSGEIYEVYYSGEYYLAEDDTMPEGTIIMDLYLDENGSEYEAASNLYTAVSFEFNAFTDVVGMSYENGDLLFGNEYDSYYQLEYTVG